MNILRQYNFLIQRLIFSFTFLICCALNVYTFNQEVEAKDLDKIYEIARKIDECLEKLT